MVERDGTGGHIRRGVVLALLLVVLASCPASCSPEFREEPLVNSWAREFGEKLYEISQTVTRAEKIEAEYRRLNASVEEKDGKLLLDQIAERIGGMLQRKTEAVKCIVERVEELAEKLGEKMNMTLARNRSLEAEFEGAEMSEERGEQEEGDSILEVLDDEEDEVEIEFTYHSAKCSPVEVVEDEFDGRNATIYDNVTCENEEIYRPMRLKADRHFYNIPVNSTHSSVHVPTNVYDQARYMLEWIDMSEGLDDVFVKNYQNDPSLSWQYFGSSFGYLRHFPAMRWRNDPDLYDCRGRPWYVEASSACTKSAVVLVDVSGSMTGNRFSIARLTAGSLLETFAPNDLVSVVTFSEHPAPLIPCFNETLVPATRENILAFKSALADTQANEKIEGYANFTAAFLKALELLEINRASKSDCSICKPYDNEIIFLITDNVPGNWSTFFEMYNSPMSSNFKWKDMYNESISSSDSSEEEKHVDSLKDTIVSDIDSMPIETYAPPGTFYETLPLVRLVAYLIGKEVFNLKEIEKFTCENRGFSVNLQSLDEVKEEVLEYIPLLATPLAMASADGFPRPIIWTHTFADVDDPKISRWLWEVMKNEEQKGRFDAYERNKKVFFTQEEEDHRYVKKRIKEDDESLGYLYQEYRLMTSVSSPAFLQRTVNTTNDTEVVADLIGVAGIDVPLDEFKELLHPYEIGVNGYGFAITKEGNILFHPDLRPVFQGSLKDGFNSVDMAEIELTDDGKGPRDFSEVLLKLRHDMVNQEKGELLGLDVLMHHDDMRRVTSINRNYYYTPLEGTPYTIAITLPSTYGLYRVKAGSKDEANLFRGKGIKEYFPGDNWKVHREWMYCKYLSETFQLFDTAEERLLHFLDKISQPDWKWKSPDSQETKKNPDTHCEHEAIARDAYKCDKSLIELLLFDARVTNKFFKTKQWDLENDEEREIFHLFNVTLRFIATHSGLTRWQEQVSDNGNDTADVFAEYFSDAIEDSWYKKSVIWYEADPGSYVYSMRYPRDEMIEDDNDLLTQVTATRAIFLKNGEKGTPASVVGYRFPHSILLDLLDKITSDYYCGNEDSKKLCTDRQDILKNGEKLSNYTGENKLFSSLSSFPSCSSGEVRCFLLDGSGYILAMMSPENTTERTGQFFGKLEPEIMSQLVDIGLYVRRPLFDYQALCIHEFITSRASILLLPFYSIQWAFQWALGQILWLLLKTNLHTILLPQWTHAAIDGYYDSYEDDPYFVTREEDDHEVLKDWRGRSIGKDDDYHPKKTVTVIKEACDKWAYRFSLTPPPPIPTTEMPSVTDVTSTTDETTESMEISSTSMDDEPEEETTASKHLEPSSSSSSWTTQPTNSASVFYPFASVKSVVSRWKRSISTSSTPAPSDNQQLGENRSTTTESNETSTKMNDTDYVEPETSCPRPFTAERIPHSDLVLVVITNSDSYLLCAEGRKENEDLEMNEENGNANEKEEEEEEVIWNPSKLDMHVGLRAVPYNDTHACHKLRTDRLPRGKRTTKCITQHPKEQIHLLACSGCTKLVLDSILAVMSLTVILMNS